MNLELVDKLARSLLYEGYILYPYRASAVKNQQRFNFGGVYPPTYSQAQSGLDACTMQTECLVESAGSATLEIRVRCLHLRAREICRLNGPWQESANIADLDYTIVDSFDIDGRSYHSWQEAVEREIVIPNLNLDALTQSPHRHEFRFDAHVETEPLCNSAGQVVALAVRRQQQLIGSVDIQALAIQPSLHKVQVQISNHTQLADTLVTNRDEALLRSLISTHTVLDVTGGSFVSLLDPPESFRTAATECKNIGAWPVLVGDEGQRSTLLSSPIILYDYPQLAPESVGELFDGTEIDEILTLRIMTLTDEEKREMRTVDERAREILERTEQLPQEHLLRMHGVMRSLRPTERSTP